jgi:hypothetical protein
MAMRRGIFVLVIEEYLFWGGRLPGIERSFQVRRERDLLAGMVYGLLPWVSSLALDP